MAEPPTGTVTFFFTDIQSSTRLWERDAKRMRRALTRHDEIMKGVVESHGGYVFKMVGDACCAAFSNASEGLAAAFGAQRALSGERWNESFTIKVRMVLHTGLVEKRGGDYLKHWSTSHPEARYCRMRRIPVLTRRHHVGLSMSSASTSALGFAPSANPASTSPTTASNTVCEVGTS